MSRTVHILNIIGLEMWKPLLEEIIKIYTLVVLVTTYTEHTRYRNVEATFRGNHETLGNPSYNSYYTY